LCMTNSASNRIPVPEPSSYNPLWFELMGRGMANAPTSLDTLDEVFFRATIPQPGGFSKADWNNNGYASLDYVGGNAGFVTTNYTTQDAILQNHINYTLGFFKFLREDSRVPSALRTSLADWGFCADEFIGEETPRGLSPEVYIRESARMVGDYVMTEAQILKTTPVSQQTAIAMGTYAMDSHPCSIRNISGVARGEGGLDSGLVPLGYYGVEYHSLLSKAKECGNFLACGNGVSASHTAFGSIRIETTLMSLGEAAGAAAALAIQGRARLHDIAGSDLQPYVRSYQINAARLLTIQAPSTNGTVTQSSSGAGWVDATWPPEFYITKLQNEGNGNKGGRWTQFNPKVVEHLDLILGDQLLEDRQRNLGLDGIGTGRVHAKFAKAQPVLGRAPPPEKLREHVHADSRVVAPIVRARQSASDHAAEPAVVRDQQRLHTADGRRDCRHDPGRRGAVDHQRHQRQSIRPDER